MDDCRAEKCKVKTGAEADREEQRVCFISPQSSFLCEGTQSGSVCFNKISFLKEESDKVIFKMAQDTPALLFFNKTNSPA